MDFSFLLIILIAASPFIIYLIIVFRNLWDYFRTTNKTRKKEIIHTLLWTYDLVFTTISSLLLLSMLLTPTAFFNIRYFLEPYDPKLLGTIFVLLWLGVTSWYGLRIFLGVIFWFIYGFASNAQKKKILQQKMNWGFKGILLLPIMSLIFYFIMGLALSFFIPLDLGSRFTQ